MQITVTIRPSHPTRGAARERHERAVGCGGRGARNRRMRARRMAKSCGPDAPMAGVKLLRSSRFLGVTVTNKLWSRRGEHGISCKPSRRESRDVSGYTCGPTPVLFLHGTHGCDRHPAFPAPSVSKRAEDDAKLGRNRVARMRMLVRKLFDN
jgi:hypothetical protein